MIKQQFIIDDALFTSKRSKSKRILLIDPPYCRIQGYLQTHFNLGLGYLAAVLKQNNFDVAVYNSEIELGLGSQTVSAIIKKNYTDIKKFLESGFNNEFWIEVKEIVKNYDPWMIGISTLTNKTNIVKKMCSFLKSYRPDIPIVLGGHHPTMFPEYMMKNYNIDYVICGEGEEKIIPLIEYHNGNKKSLKDIANIFYKEKGNIKGFKKKERLKNLDALPNPARETLLGYKEMPSHWFCGVITSRGCPFSCTYCGSKNVFGKKLILRSPESVLKEIKEINNRLGTRSFMILDDTFNVNKNFAIKIAKGISEIDKRIKWTANLRIDLIDDEQLEVFKNCGCSNIWIGIESGNDNILKTIKKNIDCSFIKKQISRIKKYCMVWGGYFMIGFPEETFEEMYNTYKFMLELEPDLAQLNILNPLPGTEIFQALYSEEENVEKINWSLRSQASLENIHFVTKNENLEKDVIKIFQAFDEYNYKRKNNLTIIQS